MENKKTSEEEYIQEILTEIKASFPEEDIDIDLAKAVIRAFTDNNPFDEFLIRSFKSAWQSLHNSIILNINNLKHWNESVYRYHYIKELLELNQSFTIQDEWKHIDVFINAGDEQAAIEIKFLDCRPDTSIDGKKIFYKGSAGKKNFSEFKKSLDLLRGLEKKTWYLSQSANVSHRYFLLIATKHGDAIGSKFDFYSYYRPEKISAAFPYISILDYQETQYGNVKVFGWIASVSLSHPSLNL